MGGLAPGQLKSRRGSHSSPRRLHYRFIFFDRDSETHCGKNSYQLCGTSAFSSPSPCGSLALNGPPDWPSPSPPPTHCADETLPVLSAGVQLTSRIPKCKCSVRPDGQV